MTFGSKYGMLTSCKSMREKLMKECIRKTNDQVFGGLARGLKSLVDTKEGRRNIAVIIVAFVIISLDVGGGIWLLDPLIANGQKIMDPIWAGIIVGVGLVVMVFVGVITVVYALTLSENCNK